MERTYKQPKAPRVQLVRVIKPEPGKNGIWFATLDGSVLKGALGDPYTQRYKDIPKNLVIGFVIGRNEREAVRAAIDLLNSRILHLSMSYYR